MQRCFTAIMLSGLILSSACGELPTAKRTGKQLEASPASAAVMTRSPSVQERTESTKVQKLVPNNDRYFVHFKIISDSATIPRSLSVYDGVATGISDRSLRTCVVAVVNDGGVTKEIKRNFPEGLTLGVCVQSLGNGKVVVEASAKMLGVTASRENGAETLFQTQTWEGRLVQTIPLGGTAAADFGTKDKIRVEVRVERADAKALELIDND